MKFLVKAEFLIDAQDSNDAANKAKYLSNAVDEIRHVEVLRVSQKEKTSVEGES